MSRAGSRASSNQSAMCGRNFDAAKSRTLSRIAISSASSNESRAKSWGNVLVRDMADLRREWDSRGPRAVDENVCTNVCIA